MQRRPFAAALIAVLALVVSVAHTPRAQADDFEVTRLDHTIRAALYLAW